VSEIWISSYREAGPQTAPVILLFHGFPTSSNMFRNLIPRLAGSFHVVAPDYPGFGQSSMPDRQESAKFSGMAAQFTLTKVRLRRKLRL
jgi:pimeloyl-ACP methyl ester carboxylesterase